MKQERPGGQYSGVVITCPSGSPFQRHLVGGLASGCEDERLCFLEFLPSNAVSSPNTASQPLKDSGEPGSMTENLGNGSHALCTVVVMFRVLGGAGSQGT